MRSTWPDAKVPQQLHFDMTVASLDELNSMHSKVLALGGSLLFDRSDSQEEPLRVYADLDGQPFCIFVAPLIAAVAKCESVANREFQSHTRDNPPSLRVYP
jgi:hypothetical protein